MIDAEILRAIEKNRQRFLKMVGAINLKSCPEKRVQICTQASIFAVKYPCGILYSHEIESELRRLADTIKATPVESFVTNSFLHVMTRTYLSGGHARVCERWIQGSPEGQKHDVALISQGKWAVPKFLEEVTQKKNGSVLRISEDFPLEKAASLRELASHYQYVILYTHMYDVIPTLAFGNADFARPIILYNHADHLFWVGSSIADLVVNHRSFTKTLDEEGRNVKSHYVLPLPLCNAKVDTKITTESSTLKATLGFKIDSKVIVTIASSYKYKPIGDMDFVKAIKEILALDDRAVVLAIGPSKEEKYWQKAYEESNGRINPIGIVPTSELDTYLRIADLALESFPFGSPVALMEIAKYNVPCVALATPSNKADIFEDAGIICKDVPAVVERVLSLLQNPPSSNKLYELLKRDCLPEGFSKKLADLYAHFPEKHQVREVEVRKNREISAFELFIAQNSLVDKRSLKNILKRYARGIIYFYMVRLYPFGMNRRIYTALNSFGLM